LKSTLFVPAVETDYYGLYKRLLDEYKVQQGKAKASVNEVEKALLEAKSKLVKHKKDLAVRI